MHAFGRRSDPCCTSTTIMQQKTLNQFDALVFDVYGTLVVSHIFDELARDILFHSA